MKTPASEPTLPGPTQTLQEVLGQVVRRLVFGHYDGRSPLAELPIAQLRCLHVIRCHEGQKMQDLADALVVKLPTLSQIVERLVRRGMVERHPDPTDRRVVRLRLTEAARTAVDAVDAARQARLTAVSDALPPEEHERVIAGLRLLIEAAVRALPDESAARAQGGGDPLVDLMARRNRATAGRRRPPLGDAKIGEP
jgi:DNA-binding MarR family transcriptional regulator